jgi:hypothetical protein
MGSRKAERINEQGWQSWRHSREFKVFPVTVDWTVNNHIVAT